MSVRLRSLGLTRDHHRRRATVVVVVAGQPCMTHAAGDFGKSFLLTARSEVVDESRVQLDLRYLLPAANANRWSDLLATMIAADPAPMSRLLGLEVDGVRREVVAAAGPASASDRLDLLLLRGGSPVAVVEVKVLADLGPQQLTRYLAAFRDVQVYRVLHLGSLPVNLKEAQPWQPITWDAVLDAYAASGHPWVGSSIGPNGHPARADPVHLRVTVRAVEANSRSGSRVRTAE